MNQFRAIFDDPIKFIRMCWPDVQLYDKQVEILRSVASNDETIVPAGNQLGKDFVAGLCALWFFCTRSPCRVITSSSGHGQLESVLWGEIRRFVNTSRYKLPIHMNHLLIRQVDQYGVVEPMSYLRGIVTNEEENLQGHHLNREGSIPRTLAIFDEASSIENRFYSAADTWAHRKLVIGNPLPCENFFKRFSKEGDVTTERDPKQYYRRVIRIRADDSPNVRLAEAQIAKGLEPTYETLIPGVIDYSLYQKRRKMWDPMDQCIKLDAEFYEGTEILLFPPVWLNAAVTRAALLSRTNAYRTAVAMGVDTAEGGDSTVWTVTDHLGILRQISYKTHDTYDIPGQTIQLIKEYHLDPRNVLFDRGGGGREHADLLRRRGYDVRTVAFGESVTPPDKPPGLRRNREDRRDIIEDRYVYKNRRAQMYGLLHNLLDPSYNPMGFGIPAEFSELRRQLRPIPKKYDDEGRLFLLSKRKKPGSKQLSLTDVIGCSPDEADSTVLAVYGMLMKVSNIVVTAG